MGLKLIDYLILFAVLLLVIGAVHLYRKRGKSGCCSGGCSGQCENCLKGCEKCKDRS